MGSEQQPHQKARPAIIRDAEARAFATDPKNNVVLEASAGTGKTSVLVARYLSLLRAGVDPSHILAITFTRKAAAEMRARIVHELRVAGEQSQADRARWRELRDRMGEIAIGTIDAFCLSLLREFPLEVDLDPGFALADETEVPRLIEQALRSDAPRLGRSGPRRSRRRDGGWGNWGLSERDGGWETSCGGASWPRPPCNGLSRRGPPI